MCNIAGYVGTKEAAPILIEMMRRQEGFNAGYYTGLATIHDGKILMDKVIGDVGVLLQNTDCANFPGNVGFIHSRSKSGGSVEWGHPFMGTGEKIAYIANGTAGLFKNAYAEAHRNAYTALRKEGYIMRSREENPVGAYTVMPDGSGVHVSDLLCQRIARYVDDDVSTMDAIEQTYITLMGEVVGLVLNREQPDTIFFGRINFPMFAGFANHGTYLSSTPQAFPDDVKSVKSLNVMSCGAVYKDRLVEKPLNTNTPITDVTPKHYKDCYDAVCAAISQKEMTCEDIDEVMLDVLGRDVCAPYPAVEYEILWELEKQGRLRIDKYRVKGAVPELTAPEFRMSFRGAENV